MVGNKELCNNLQKKVALMSDANCSEVCPFSGRDNVEPAVKGLCVDWCGIERYVQLVLKKLVSPIVLVFFAVFKSLA